MELISLLGSVCNDPLLSLDAIGARKDRAYQQSSSLVFTLVSGQIGGHVIHKQYASAANDNSRCSLRCPELQNWPAPICLDTAMFRVRLPFPR